MRPQHILMPFVASLLLAACATNDPGESRKTTNPQKIANPPKITNTQKITSTQKGAVTGTASGAAAGAVINHKNRGKGALLGAVGGGLTGTAVGAYMDQQTKEMEGQLQAEIQRGEITLERRASDNALLVRMMPTNGFDNLSSVIKPGYLSTLNRIARVLNQYEKTLLTVIGHTDSVGSDADNQRLSERRAQSVIDYFINQNVNPIRLQSYGKGESEPRADTTTDAGRQLNRRVELWIQPVVAQ